jgi:hypothetical protein
MSQAHEFADGSHQSCRTMMGVASRATSDAGLPLLPGQLHLDRWLLGLGLLFVASFYFFPRRGGAAS